MCSITPNDKPACECPRNAMRAERDSLSAENARLRNLTHTPVGTTWKETADARFGIMQDLRAELATARDEIEQHNLWREEAYRQMAALRARVETLEAGLRIQVKAWHGVVEREGDGPIVDFAEAQIKRIDAALKEGK